MRIPMTIPYVALPLVMLLFTIEEALAAVFMPVIILSGILGEIFAPTEAAGVAVEQLPQQMVGWLSQAHITPMLTLILMNIGLLLLGIPLETAPALTIVVPVLAPMAAQLGIDPIHLGIIVCFNLVLGLVTPPVGGVLFSVCGITGMPLEKLGKAIWGPFAIALIVLLLITFIPGLSTFLPRLLMG